MQFWGAKIKVNQVKMFAIASLLAFASTFTASVMASDASGTLTVSASVESACNIDNTSLNFSVNQTDELKGTNRVTINSADSQGTIPLSVTCKNSALYQTYLTTLATSRTLNNSHIEFNTSLTSKLALTIIY